MNNLRDQVTQIAEKAFPGITKVGSIGFVRFVHYTAIEFFKTARPEDSETRAIRAALIMLEKSQPINETTPAVE